MNIIRPGIAVSGFFFVANLVLIKICSALSFYVYWAEFEKIVSRPENLVRLTTNKL